MALSLNDIHDYQFSQNDKGECNIYCTFYGRITIKIYVHRRDTTIEAIWYKNNEEYYYTNTTPNTPNVLPTTEMIQEQLKKIYDNIVRHKEDKEVDEGFNISQLEID